MYVDHITYNCNTFEDDLLKSRKELFLKRQFADVTLVSDDMVPFPAHRTVLSSSSMLLKSLFEVTNEPRQVLFLKGVSQIHLQSILKFIYLGETSVRADQVKDFSAAVNELGIDKLKIDDSNTEQTAERKQDTKKLVEKLDFLSPFEETSNFKDVKVDCKNLDFLETENSCEKDGDPSEESKEKNYTLEEDTDFKSEIIQNNESEAKFSKNDSDDINLFLKEASLQLFHSTTEDEEDKLQDKTENGDDSADGSKNDLTEAQRKRKELYLKRKPEEPSECSVCARVFTTQRSMQRHHKTVHELVNVGKYDCEECGKKLYNKQTLQSHIDAVHRKIFKFKCDICGKSSSLKSSLRRHKEKHHPLPKCDSCNVKFKTDSEFNMHLQKEHIEKYCR